jgi:hypothetical protein
MSILTFYLKMVEFIKRARCERMTNITFEFNRTKAIESILYLANKLPNPGKYIICKRLYLADKRSLENYGRFIFGDSYSAMERGATPSSAYDLLKEAAETPVEGIEVQGNRVIPLRESNLDCLSQSDIECLEQAIQVPSWRIKQEAHDDAWQKSWDNRGNKGSAEIPVENIAKLFSNSDDLIDYLANVG